MCFWDRPLQRWLCAPGSTLDEHCVRSWSTQRIFEAKISRRWAPWVRKFDYLCIREILVVTFSHVTVRPSVRTTHTNTKELNQQVCQPKCNVMQRLISPPVLLRKLTNNYCWPWYLRKFSDVAFFRTYVFLLCMKPPVLSRFLFLAVESHQLVIGSKHNDKKPVPFLLLITPVK